MRGIVARLRHKYYRYVVLILSHDRNTVLLTDRCAYANH